MKYLVTGGLGFIGSNLVDALVENGHEVIVVDDLSTGQESYKNEKATTVIESITNHERMLELTQSVDAIFHVAAWARLQRSVDDPLGTNNANIVGTLSMLQAARINKVPRFIFSSSSSVYGEQADPIMREDMELNPLHPYALQKWAGEQYCKLFSRLFQMNTVCLRYFNVYGPRQIVKGDYALVIGKFLRQKAEGGAMTIYGDGEQTRAYTHVSDVVRANILAANMPYRASNFDVFNIGTNVETSINQIADMLGGERQYINPNPRGNFEERRKAANNQKALDVLGWQPSVSIEEGVKRLLEHEN